MAGFRSELMKVRDGNQGRQCPNSGIRNCCWILERFHYAYMAAVVITVPTNKYQLTNIIRVACGIMMGFVVNLAVASLAGSLDMPLSKNETKQKQYLTAQFILGAPVVPSVALFLAVYFCYESPRFYMREDSPNFDPNRALAILLAIRRTRVRHPRWQFIPQMTLEAEISVAPSFA
jgi:hypothetical protein